MFQIQSFISSDVWSFWIVDDGQAMKVSRNFAKSGWPKNQILYYFVQKVGGKLSTLPNQLLRSGINIQSAKK